MKPNKKRNTKYKKKTNNSDNKRKTHKNWMKICFDIKFGTIFQLSIKSIV